MYFVDTKHIITDNKYKPYNKKYVNNFYIWYKGYVIIWIFSIDKGGDYEREYIAKAYWRN